MKIDADLRAAIRSAEKMQPQDDWESRSRAAKETITALLKSRRYARAYQRALLQKKQGAALLDQANEFFRSLGLSSGADRIEDDQKFVKAGGALPPPPLRRWKFDTVMAELAAAPDEKAGAKILQRYGINWR